MGEILDNTNYTENQGPLINGWGDTMEKIQYWFPEGKLSLYTRI